MNLAVDADVADAYVRWLVPHMEEMLALPGFVSATLADAEAVPMEQDDQKHYVATYVLRDRAALQTYFDVHSARLRGDGVNRPAPASRPRRLP